MRVIICGAGQVGYHIASYLSRENNDVTVIDHNATLVGEVNDELDVNGILGHASDPNVLDAAGANDADLLISVTTSDEVNMVACQVAHSLFGVPKKIARIRQQSYLDSAWSNLFSRAHMPIDVIISPEAVIAEDIYQRLTVPGATYVIPLADDKLHLIGVICDENCPVLYTPISELKKLFPDLSFEILAILRKNNSIIPNESDQLEIGDEVFFIVDTKHLPRTIAAFGIEGQEARRIVIMGGGSVGLSLINLLHERTYGTQIKVIEKNEERANYLSEQLENVVVFLGDGLDKDLLFEVGVENTETFIAITDDDENNILGSLLAKQYGCQRNITLVNNNAYSPLVGPLGVDTMIMPKITIAANIMQHIRRGRIRALYNLRDGFAEIIEAEVSDSSAIINKSISLLDLPKDVVLAAIIRNGDIVMPDENEEIKVGDNVIILATQEHIKTVEKLFSVHVDLF